MPVRYLSHPELARLSGWPGEIADADAVTYFTLSADDQSWLAGFNRAEPPGPAAAAAEAYATGRATRCRPGPWHYPPGVASQRRHDRYPGGAQGPAKLECLRRHGADQLDLSQLPAGLNAGRRTIVPAEAATVEATVFVSARWHGTSTPPAGWTAAPPTGITGS